MTLDCSPSSFVTPTLMGAEFTSLQASLVTNYTAQVPRGFRFSQPGLYVENLEYCSVIVTYTHPGENDYITVEAWLPTRNYNNRLQSIGGGGWQAGRYIITYLGMAGAIADGYATVTTDAGLGDSFTYEPWALLSPGNLNQYSLQNLGHVSLNDEAIIAKSLIKSFYGQEPEFSYWNGCSQGGRQGSMLAQQYPTAYNGIIAAAPAIDWAGLIMSTIWPRLFMHKEQQFPAGCELTELTSLAVSVCDPLDGVTDGLISEPDACRRAFDPSKYIGTTFNCSTTGQDREISAAAVAVANAVWMGATHADGRFLWHGFDIGADLATIAPTNCTIDGHCTAAPLDTIASVSNYWVTKDINANTTDLTHQDFDTMYRVLKHVFASSLQTNEPDITDFRNAGGKIITFHGLNDAAIPPNNSLAYYKQVMQTVDDTFDFYRYYTVPGLEHCFGGKGGQPENLFNQLRQWVENGTAPVETAVTVELPDGTNLDEILCPYPLKAKFDASCNNSTGTTTCWSCVN
ncbi:unnamed protein product [Clonostachys chloroleuca]|uniref:Carboxylic ester hydrolase n=1 Tax=Clonostachys chloroleuca TaxID=1926264 RepID=A0AA35LT71_9HYPO|nr:unnamed protein product [Clonostachys chloroleuca]